MKRIIKTDKAPAPVGPYSQAVISGGLMFISGQVGVNPETRNMVEGGVPAQTVQALQNIQAVLEAAGIGFDKVLKTSVFLVDMDHFTAMNEAYSRFFKDHSAARTTIQAAKLPLGALVEIDLIAQTNGCCTRDF